jgi:RecB family exonuclease
MAPSPTAADAPAARPSAPAAALTLLPTQRLVRQRSAEADGGGARRYLTFDDLFARLYAVMGDGRPWLGGAARDRAIRRLIRRRAESVGGLLKSVDGRPGLRAALVQYLADLRTRGVRPGHFADLPADAGGLAADVAALYAEYDATVPDSGRHEWAVAGAVRAGQPLPPWLDVFTGPAAGGVVVESTDLLTASQRALLSALAERGVRVTFRWPYPRATVERLPPLREQADWLEALARRCPSAAAEYPPDPAPTGRGREAGTDGAKEGDLARLRRTLFGFEAPAPSVDGSVRLIAAPDKVAEIDAVARDIRRRLLGENPEGLVPADIAVILGDAAYGPLVFERFARAGIAFHSRRGGPLAGRPVFRYLRRLFELPLKSFAAREVLGVLQSAYCPFRDGPETERWFVELNYGGPADDETLSARLKRRRAELERRLAEREAAKETDRDGETAERLRGRIEREAKRGEAIVGFLGRVRGWAAAETAEARIKGAEDLLDYLLRIPFGDGEDEDWRDLAAVRGILSEQRGGLRPGETLPLDEWLAEFDALAAGRSSGALGRPDGVQIVTVQEVSGLRFRLAYAPGLLAGGFPRGERTDPFLPAPARGHVSRRLAAEGLPGLPEEDDDTQRDRVYFARAVHAVESTLVLTTPVTPETMEETPPSEFYADAEFLFGGRESGHEGETTLPRESLSVSDRLPRPAEAATRGELHARAALDLFEPRPATEPSAPAVYARLREADPAATAGWLRAGAVDRRRTAAMRAGRADPWAGLFAGDPAAEAALAARFFEASGAILLRGSALDTFGNCPFKLLAGEVLRAEPMGIPDGSLPHRLRGTFAHKVMEEFYREESRRLTLPDRTRDGPALRKLIADGLAALKADGSLTDEPAAALLEAELSLRLVNALEDDKEFRGETKAAPELLEYDLEAVALKAGPHRFALHGRIDRVDADDRGAAVVIDYKDSPSANDKQKENDFARDFRLGTRVQTALYALALSADAPERLKAGGWKRGGAPSKVRGAFYHLKAKKTAVVARMAKVFGGLVPDKKGRLAGAEFDWREVLLGHLERYAEAVTDKAFPALPTAMACKFCEFAGICRKPADVKTRGAEGGADGQEA